MKLTLSILAGILCLVGSFEFGRHIERNTVPVAAKQLIDKWANAPDPVTVDPTKYLQSVAITQDDRGQYIEANLINSGSEKISTAYIVWRMYDNQNVQLGTHTSYASAWQPGESYRIKDRIAPVAYRVEIDSITLANP